MTTPAPVTGALAERGSDWVQGDVRDGAQERLVGCDDRGLVGPLVVLVVHKDPASVDAASDDVVSRAGDLIPRKACHANQRAYLEKLAPLLTQSARKPLRLIDAGGAETFED